MASSNRVKRQKLCIAFPPLRPRDVGDGWAEFAIAHPSCSRPFNLISTRAEGADCEPNFTNCPTCFMYLPPSLYVIYPP